MAKWLISFPLRKLPVYPEFLGLEASLDNLARYIFQQKYGFLILSTIHT